jgi:hypothetical protein
MDVVNSNMINLQIGKNNEIIITIAPEANKVPRQLREKIVKVVADALAVDIEIISQASVSLLGEIVDANGWRYAIPAQITKMAKSGQAGWITLCENHVGYENKVEITSLASEVKAKFSNIFGSTFEGSLAIGIAKSFQKLIDLNFISYEEYNPDPNNPKWKRRRYWVTPQQAKNLQRIGHKES